MTFVQEMTFLQDMTFVQDKKFILIYKIKVLRNCDKIIKSNHLLTKLYQVNTIILCLCNMTDHRL